MSAVADVLDALMTMLSWLEKPPYGAHMIGTGGSEKNPYSVFSQWYVSLGIELATNAQRDAFAENPVETIQKCCLKLADYSDTLIRDLEDPLILQPASLDIGAKYLVSFSSCSLKLRKKNACISFAQFIYCLNDKIEK